MDSSIYADALQLIRYHLNLELVARGKPMTLQLHSRRNPGNVIPCRDSGEPILYQKSRTAVCKVSRICLRAAAGVLNSNRIRTMEFLPQVQTVYISTSEFSDSLWFNSN